MTRRPNKHYFLIDAKAGTRIGVKARNATKCVALSRELVDLIKGTQGMSVTCGNVQCSMRLGEAAFPHKVYMAEFTDNRAYIVDNLTKKGEILSCVVYAHGEGQFQRAYDTTPKQRLLKMSGMEKTFILRPPPVIRRDHPKPSNRSGPTGTSHTVRKGRQHTPFGVGAIERARRAGIVTTAKKKA